MRPAPGFPSAQPVRSSGSLKKTGMTMCFVTWGFIAPDSDCFLISVTMRPNFLNRRKVAGRFFHLHCNAHEAHERPKLFTCKQCCVLCEVFFGESVVSLPTGQPPAFALGSFLHPLLFNLCERGPLAGFLFNLACVYERVNKNLFFFAERKILF